MSAIRRGDDWWHRREDGVWLRWSTASASWEPQSATPPPPPPPAAPLQGSPPPVDAEAGAAGAPGAVALQVRPEPGPVLGPADLLDTVPFPAEPTAPLPTLSLARGRAANEELCSPGSSGPLALLQSPAGVRLAAALAVLTVFLLTYLGASLVFSSTGAAESASEPGEPSLRRAFIAEVDRLCAEASRSALGLPPPGSPAQTADFTKRAIATQRKLVSDMAKLSPPAKDRGLFRAILKSSTAQVGEMRVLLRRARSGHAAGIREALEVLASSEKRIDRMSADYGLEECSKA